VTYPFGNLPGNLVAFCASLRREHGFRIGPGEIVDAARVLELVDLADEREVRQALRPVLSGTREEAQAFDGAFQAFFYPGPAGTPQEGLSEWAPPRVSAHGPTVGATRQPATGEMRTDADAGDESGSAGRVDTIDEDTAEDEPAAPMARASWSPLQPEGRELLRLDPVNAEWQTAARAFVRHVQLGRSRRWRPGLRGVRFDLRRTWRASLQTGGEALRPHWLHRPRRVPRFVVLIDGSRSMGRADTPALMMAVALASVTARLDVFVFSTALECITGEVYEAARGRSRFVDLGHDAWGGGTDIGASLRAFLATGGPSLLGRFTTVMIVSDGLDVGDPRALGEAVRELHRRSAGVTWLNPLVATIGYAPVSAGMAAAMPFVTTFSHVDDAAGLVRLAHTIRIRG
jgi:uncharacterized protein with von Willebrand factor type A (vWA) domain